MSASNCSFTTSAMSRDRPIRIDCRSPMQSRVFSIRRGPLNGQAEAHIGKTVVRTTVSGEITPPSSDRPNEGRLFFNVELGSIADPTLGENGRQRSDVTTICNFTERLLKGSKALDPESLCILGGRSVWCIRCDIHVLNDDGCLLDACALSVLAALLNFKCQSLDIVGESVNVFSSSSREPVPLSVHHLPISTTFAISNTPTGVTWVVDPCLTEEAAFESTLTVIVNQHGELCGIHKPGGIAIEPDVLEQCMDLAIVRAKEVTVMMLHRP